MSRTVATQGVRHGLSFRPATPDIELLEAMSPESPICQGSSRKRGEGIPSHLFFASTTSMPTLGQLKAQGYRLINEAPVAGRTRLPRLPFLHPAAGNGRV